LVEFKLINWPNLPIYFISSYTVDTASKVE
jgi:hypothetical protein